MFNWELLLHELSLTSFFFVLLSVLVLLSCAAAGKQHIAIFRRRRNGNDPSSVILDPVPGPKDHYDCEEDRLVAVIATTHVPWFQQSQAFEASASDILDTTMKITGVMG